MLLVRHLAQAQDDEFQAVLLVAGKLVPVRLQDAFVLVRFRPELAPEGRVCVHGCQSIPRSEKSGWALCGASAWVIPEKSDCVNLSVR